MVRRCMGLVSVILSENEREREHPLFLVLVVGERKRKKGNERQARHTIETSIGHWTSKIKEMRE